VLPLHTGSFAVHTAVHPPLPPSSLTSAGRFNEQAATEAAIAK
jgi:hypothetical protein